MCSSDLAISTGSTDTSGSSSGSSVRTGRSPSRSRSAPAPMCGETHATELGDHADERTGGWASARTAQATAHFRLSIAATSAGPFRLHGGRAA